MRTTAFFALLLFTACSDDASSSASSTNDGGVEGDGATSSSTTPTSSACPRGTMRAVWSDPSRAARDVCLATSTIARGGAPGAATLISLYEGTQARPTSWMVVQVDGATESKLGLVAYYLSPSEPKTSFTRTCGSAACPEIQVSPSTSAEGARVIALRGLVLSAEGGGDVTLTGDLEAR